MQTLKLGINIGALLGSPHFTNPWIIIINKGIIALGVI